MTPDRLLMMLAAEAGRDGHVCPQLDTAQARRAAEQLLAAAGLTRVEPPRELPAGPAPAPPDRAAMDSPTVATPIVPRRPAWPPLDPTTDAAVWTVTRDADGRLTSATPRGGNWDAAPPPPARRGPAPATDRRGWPAAARWPS